MTENNTHDEEWLKEKAALHKYAEEIKKQHEKGDDYTVVRLEYRYDKDGFML